MRNCREYCPHSQLCARYYPLAKGEPGLSHNDCPIAWKIEDILMDTVPFYDPDEDLPEEEEEEP